MDSNGQASHDYFIDGVTNLSFTAGAFRFDLVSLIPDASSGKEDGEQKQQLKKHARVIMTPQGYAQMLKSMQDILDKVREHNIPQSDQ
ncbi:hypothetical protein [Legionella sp. CNM-4043-24]|uniref:hypothetical protein n=1 Tax=Legionella sp. CNM-4043-24 TaxID=3421646 RepID=UPI00403AE805